jgi:prepilin-type processing-associated H-X9-DG protein
MSCFFRPRVVASWGRYLFSNLESTAVTTPANTWVFTDEHEDTIDDSSFLIMPENSPVWFSLPSTRHGRSTPFSFLDGHCEPHRWVEPSTFVPVQRKRRGNTPVGPADRDTLWLRNAASPLIVD